jgi:hypothetical protein
MLCYEFSSQVAHICKVFYNSDHTWMINVFPDAQADDGADYWSKPSKQCGTFWETVGLYGTSTLTTL